MALGPTHSNEQLVELLNTAGLRTGTGRPFDITAVQWIRHTHHVPVPKPQTDDELSVKEVAARLGITADAVYYWIANAYLDVRRTSTNRICVYWNPKIEAACRRCIAGSGHLTPKTSTRGPAEGAE